MSVAAGLRCVAASRNICGEGVVWHAEQNAVYWTDINGRLLQRLECATGELECWNFAQPVTALALTSESSQMLVVLGGEILLWSAEAPDDLSRVLYRLPEWPEARCNDARVSPAGSLWFGTMQNNVAANGDTTPITANMGALRSLRPAGHVTQWDGGMGISNTVCWSAQDDELLFGDTLANCIYRYPFDRREDRVGARGHFTSGFTRGLPDGSALDAEGWLWNCRYGGSCIVRFAPDGSVDRVVEMPVENPTTCAFGGADLRTLYVTSARQQGPHAEALDGNLFALDCGVAGRALPRFQL